ncbi:Fc.00g027840.m01.CDS01 [Cosmosporella sp. VM-42]
MGDILNLSRECLQGFSDLESKLDTPESVNYLQLMPPSQVRTQSGKFRVWCGNLGALETGYSALEHRLKDSAIMQSNVLKLLIQLELSLKESMAVVSGRRLAFEDQPRPHDISNYESADDSDSDGSSESRHELSMRLSGMIDLLNSLYKLSYKIRNPNLRPASTKAISYKEIDPETNIDVFDEFVKVDKTHVSELLSFMRQGRDVAARDHEFLQQRLATSITLRRKYFGYWKKHANKLSRSIESPNLISKLSQFKVSSPVPLAFDRGQPQAQRARVPDFQPQPVSETNATPYNAALDDTSERGSILSVASTALDAEGNGVEIPSAPIQAQRGEDFSCPYCNVLCSAKQGHGKAWKAHVLYDLQPYICTYANCPLPKELYRSRKQWAEHENSVHRSCWRCFDHQDCVYTSPEGLRNHLESEHEGAIKEAQIADLIRLCAFNFEDARKVCPICFQQQPFTRGLTNHLANHLERFALFALPRFHVEVENSAEGNEVSRRNQRGSRTSLDTDQSLNFSDRGKVGDSGSVSSEYPKPRGRLRIAVAGGGGLGALIAKELSKAEHDIAVLSRYDRTIEYTNNAIRLFAVDYENPGALDYALVGVDMVISTIKADSQLNLINAAARSGVKVFVPAEFEGALEQRPIVSDPLDPGSLSFEARSLLRKWAQHSPMRYTVFSCGVFMERFHPNGLSSFAIGHSSGVTLPGDYILDINHHVAEYVDRDTHNHTVRICMTSVHDVARFVAAAVDLGPATWPREFTMRGDRISIRDLVATCDRFFGVPFSHKRHQAEDLPRFVSYFAESGVHDTAEYYLRLLVTVNGRYDFRGATLNDMVCDRFRPLSFLQWLDIYSSQI